MPVWDKTIKRQRICMIYVQYRNEAKIDYPNRFLSVAQVCPVSSGHTIASVRNEDMYVNIAYPCGSVNGF